MNLYLYCRAGPVTYVDPDGMDPLGFAAQLATSNAAEAAVGAAKASAGPVTQRPSGLRVQLDDGTWAPGPPEAVAASGAFEVPGIEIHEGALRKAEAEAQNAKNVAKNEVEKLAWKAEKSRQNSTRGYASGVAQVLFPTALFGFVQDPSEESLGNVGTNARDTALAFLPQNQSDPKVIEASSEHLRYLFSPERTAEDFGKEHAPIWGAVIGATAGGTLGTPGAPWTEGLDTDVASAGARVRGPGSGLKAQTQDQLRSSFQSYEERIAEHEQKLADYKADPMGQDNEGRLKRAPSEAIRQRIIAGRVKVLEGQIAKQRGELAKIRKLLGGGKQ